jgi:hypothetical protein
MTGTVKRSAKHHHLHLRMQSSSEHPHTTKFQPVSSRSLSFQSLNDKLKLVGNVAMYAAVSVMFPKVATAASSLEAANNKLSSYGFPPLLYEPPGFSTIVSEYGRGNIREQMSNPILVQFSYPNLWVTATTSVNNNGEAGTISAGDYIKGDSAYFYTTTLKEGEVLSESNKDLIKKYIIKCKNTIIIIIIIMYVLPLMKLILLQHYRRKEMIFSITW